jgi:hypothetical protein
MRIKLFNNILTESVLTNENKNFLLKMKSIIKKEAEKYITDNFVKYFTYTLIMELQNSSHFDVE